MACHVGTEDLAPLKQLTGLSNRYDAYGLVDLLRAPRPPMPPYPFTDADREALAKYLLRAHP